MPAEAHRGRQAEMEVRISAPASEVWEALTGEVAAWWGGPYLYSAKLATDIRMEPRPGGRFYEVWGDEEGALWASVIQV